MIEVAEKEKTSVATLNKTILEMEILQMLENENPLTGIYSIYGDYPIELWDYSPEMRAKFIEKINGGRY